MTTTTLNTKITADGQVLSFPDGRDAGKITYDADTQRFRHVPPEIWGIRFDRDERYSLEAAQFDALAWAAEVEARARYSYEPASEL